MPAFRAIRENSSGLTIDGRVGWNASYPVVRDDTYSFVSSRMESARAQNAYAPQLCEMGLKRDPTHAGLYWYLLMCLLELDLKLAGTPL